MKDKKQELIELVALKALQVNEAQCGISKSRITESLDEIGMQEKAERIEQAKAIIDLLGVEVVGDDSEVEEGDIITDIEDKQMPLKVGEFATFRNRAIKIIQRNNCPVVNVDRIKEKKGE